MTASARTAVDACSADELRTAKTRVVSIGGEEVFLLWNDGNPSGLANTCIHRQRRISEGALFNGRVVCPGHQWSFDMTTGYCKERDRYQPRYEVRIVGDRVLVDPVAVTGPLHEPVPAAAETHVVPDTPSPEQRLTQQGFDLPPYSAPVGSYLKAARWGDLLFLSGHSPVRADGSRVCGKVGAELTAEQAYDAARLVGLGLLGTLRRELGDLTKVAKVLKVLGMVNAAPGFTAAPSVVDGCSDVLLAVLGEEVGRHARSAVCVAELPFNIPVEVEAVVAVRAGV